jgi:outer membrane lipopolysaccharide assembly protein LptE/RlpB
MWGTLGACVAATVAAVMLVVATGCGYHTSAKATQLPPDLHTIAVPMFINGTESYRMEQIVTAAVVREFNTRTNYRVVPQADGADATLFGRITGASYAPVTYDSKTGRTSTAVVNVTVAVKLVDKHGKLLYEQPAYVWREEYEISRDITTFFQEDAPAVDRLANDFARDFVSNVLEAF